MGAVHYFHFRTLDRVGVDEASSAVGNDNDYDYDYDYDYNGVSDEDNDDLDQVDVSELSTAASDPHVNHL